VWRLRVDEPLEHADVRPEPGRDAVDVGRDRVCRGPAEWWQHRVCQVELDDGLGRGEAVAEALRKALDELVDRGRRRSVGTGDETVHVGQGAVLDGPGKTHTDAVSLGSRVDGDVHPAGVGGVVGGLG
jgi:hypothetical protein